MKTVHKTAKVETAYGVTLATPVEFIYQYEELQKGDSVPDKEKLDDDDIRSFVNQKRNATARSAAQNEALTNAGIEKPSLKDDAEFRLKTMVKVLVAAGNSETQAEQIARSALGMTVAA